MMPAITDQTLLTTVFESTAVKEPLPFEPFEFSLPFISNIFFLAWLCYLANESFHCQIKLWYWFHKFQKTLSIIDKVV